VTLWDAGAHKVNCAAEVPAAGLPPADDRSRTERFASTALREALASAELSEALAPRPIQFAPGHSSARCGLVLGTTTAGMAEAEPVLARLDPARLDAAALDVTERTQLRAFPLSSVVDGLLGEFDLDARHQFVHALSVCSACSSGALALAAAARWIASGEVDIALAGGADAACRLTYAGFDALGALDSEGARPFDAQRAGLTLGEGAAFVVLESEERARARGARVLAWLRGWALGSEAHHSTHPEPTGASAEVLLRTALALAGVEPGEVGWVNAHGTGTLHNDAMEARAFARVFGPRGVPVSSMKGQVGHTLGAAGALEAALGVLAIAQDRVPPSGGFAAEDGSLELNVVTEARPLTGSAWLKTSFGFGGASAVLLFERPAASSVSGGGRPGDADLSVELAVSSIATVLAERSYTELDEQFALLTGGAAGLSGGAAGFAAGALGKPVSALDPERSRRFDAGASCVVQSIEAALSVPPSDRSATGVAVGTTFGGVERTAAFLKRLFERGPRAVPPAEFPHILPSASSGHASLYAGLRGPCLAVSDLWCPGLHGFELACSLVEGGDAKAMLATAQSVRDRIVAAMLAPGAFAADAPERAGAGTLDAALSVLVERSPRAAERATRPLARVVARGVDSFRALRERAVSRRAIVVLSEALTRRWGSSCGDAEPWPGQGAIGLRVEVVRVVPELAGLAEVAVGALLVAMRRDERVLALREERGQLRFVELAPWGCA
jgi:3-oxoacyl-[acyl-carrier-protein] synthase II